METKHLIEDSGESVAVQGQRDFFNNYLWSTNPFLTFRELIARTGDELERCRKCTVQWQRSEMMVNLYIFACAMSCTADDYLSRRRWHIMPLARMFPRFGKLIHLVENVLNYPLQFRSSVRLRAMWRWKEELDRFTEMTCRSLVNDGEPAESEIAELSRSFGNVRAGVFPPDFMKARMRLNEGYVCQDLHADDIMTLGKRFLDTNPDKDAEYVIVGARTAGSYFAPLLKIYLQEHGVKNVNWITLRPRYGAHGMEAKRLKMLLRQDVNVLLSDDYSNTGKTVRMLEKCVLDFGADPGRITMLVPVHPAADVDLSAAIQDKARNKASLVTVRLDDLRVAEMLEPASMERMICEVLSESGVRSVAMMENEWTDEVNRRLWSHYPDSFQARLKRVYDAVLRYEDGTDNRKKIIAKSVGFGWLGYHAYIAGRALEGFVPEVLGLREGILIMEWIEGAALTDSEVTDEIIEKMSSYLARRRETLALAEDPKGNIPYLGWGWLEILSILRSVYNRLLGYLKYPALLDRLKLALKFRPTLIDGRMRPGEWIRSDGGLVKIDFEQHCFGAPELDVVDPAYDIAATVFEFHLDEASEDRLVENYSARSGDAETLRERIFINKLLYATSESERAFHRIMKCDESVDCEKLNERLLRSWNFRVYTMNKFVSSLLGGVGTRDSNSGLFFMDLDGVFDSEIMGFPHTTARGLEAISLLGAAGYKVVPNTGRSIEHVRDYCRNFGFIGGIAEYGSVMLNMKTGTELSLVDNETLDELGRCRKSLREMKGVLIDPAYHYAIRAYRYVPGGTQGLTIQEAEEFLERNELEGLKLISRKADTYFMCRNVDKGSAIEPFKMFTGFSGDSTAAIGDSKEDISMLKMVRYPYAPSNCSSEIRRLERKLGCTVLSGAGQTGLLDAVASLLKVDMDGLKSDFILSYPPDSLQQLVVRLLTIADFPLHKRLLALLKRKDLS